MDDSDVIARFEGIPIQEARLSYAERQKLPQSAFCGPNKSYPSYDAAHVRNAFARLSQFGHRLPIAVRKKIYKCLVGKAKKYGVEHDPKKYKWGKHVTETATDYNAILQWFNEEFDREHQ